MIVSCELWDNDKIIQDILKDWMIYRIRYDWMRNIVKIQVKIRKEVFYDNQEMQV